MDAYFLHRLSEFSQAELAEFALAPLVTLALTAILLFFYFAS